jgi:RNA polymerase sigma-70 factor (ECF subfamily)
VSREDLDALVARAQAGEVRAFEALVAGHLPQVRRFARAFAASAADADDLAQDALLRVHRNLRLFRWQASFSSWLYAIVRNAFLDAERGRAATRRAREEPLRPEHAEAAGGERPDEALQQAQERERVWAALRQVPVEFRTALVLFDIEGSTYDEVAAVEGVAVGTVKSRLFRGRAHLRRLLGEAEGAGPGSGASRPSGTVGAPPTSHPVRRP